MRTVGDALAQYGGGSGQTMIDSSGNVFANLEVAESEDASLKASLASAISTLAAAMRFTQTRAAKVLGTDLPKVSALIGNHVNRFSVSRPHRFLLPLDRDVEIIVTPKQDAPPV